MCDEETRTDLNHFLRPVRNARRETGIEMGGVYLLLVGLLVSHVNVAGNGRPEALLSCPSPDRFGVPW